MRIYFVNCGETLFNELHKTQGWSDTPLTKIGKQQAEFIRDKLVNVKFDYIYCSTSERSVDTLHLIFPNRLDYVETKLLKSINYGMLEAMEETMRKKMLNTKLDNDFEELKNGYKLYNGESYEDVKERVNSFFNAYIRTQSENSTILVVTHKEFTQIAFDYMISTRTIKDGDCVIIDYTKGQFTLVENISCNVSRETL